MPKSGGLCDKQGKFGSEVVKKNRLSKPVFILLLRFYSLCVHVDKIMSRTFDCSSGLICDASPIGASN